MSNRLRNYWIGLIAGFTSAVMTGSLFWVSAEDADRSIQTEVSEKAAEQNVLREITVREKCANIVSPSTRRECANLESEPYREAERNERNLEAQRVIANWTRVMGKASIIGMGVGIIGLFLIFVTFWETRKAADAGREANQIARYQQRARIVPFARWEPQPRGASHIVLGCENVGLSPALNLRCSLQVFDEVPHIYPHFNEWGEKRMIRANDDADLTICQSGVLEKVLVGCIRYDTIYQTDRETLFCMRFEHGTVASKWFAVDCTPDFWPRPD